MTPPPALKNLASRNVCVTQLLPGRFLWAGIFPTKKFSPKLCRDFYSSAQPQILAPGAKPSSTARAAAEGAAIGLIRFHVRVAQADMHFVGGAGAVALPAQDLLAADRLAKDRRLPRSERMI